MHPVIIIHTVCGDFFGAVIHKICAPSVSRQAVQGLYDDISECLLSPIPSVVATNFDFSWELIRGGIETRLYSFPVNDDDLERLILCHQKEGRPGGPNLWDHWLPGFLEKEAPFRLNHDPRCQDSLRGGTVILTAFDYRKGNPETDGKTGEPPA